MLSPSLALSLPGGLPRFSSATFHRDQLNNAANNNVMTLNVFNDQIEVLMFQSTDGMKNIRSRVRQHWRSFWTICFKVMNHVLYTF